MATTNRRCIISAFGPGPVGLVRELSGGYEAALAMCIALQLTAAAVVVWGRRSSPVMTQRMKRPSDS